MKKANPRNFYNKHCAYQAQGLITNEPQKLNHENPRYQSSAKIASLENLYLYCILMCDQYLFIAIL